MSKTTAKTAAAKPSLSFKAYVENHAYGRGEAARAELAKLTKKFPEYTNEKMYAKNFPVLTKRYQGFIARTARAAKSA